MEGKKRKRTKRAVFQKKGEKGKAAGAYTLKLWREDFPRKVEIKESVEKEEKRDARKTFFGMV